MLKRIGLIVCALASAGAGVWQAISHYRRVRLTVGLASFSRAIREGVTKYAWDQQIIYQRFHDTRLEKLGYLSALLDETDRKPWGALYRVSHAFFEKEDPGKEAKDIFLSFAETFGSLGMEEQARACDELEERMSNLASKEKDALWNGIRLSLTAGTAAGLGILILFW